MKKILVVIIFVLILTGCRSDLVCTRKSSERGVSVEERYVTTFEDNKIATITWTYTSALTGSEITPSHVDNTLRTAEAQAEIFNSLEGVTSTVDAGGRRIVMKTTFIIAEMDEMDIIRLHLFLDRDNYRELKVDSGFTCR